MKRDYAIASPAINGQVRPKRAAPFQAVCRHSENGSAPALRDVALIHSRVGAAGSAWSSTAVCESVEVNPETQTWRRLRFQGHQGALDGRREIGLGPEMLGRSDSAGSLHLCRKPRHLRGATLRLCCHEVLSRSHTYHCDRHCIGGENKFPGSSGESANAV